MKSNNQRRKELDARKRARAAKHAAAKLEEPKRIGQWAPVNQAALRADVSYDTPVFVWTATQPKWWYEVAKGGVWMTAQRCRACRRRERERKAEARRVHLEGWHGRSGGKNRGPHP